MLYTRPVSSAVFHRENGALYLERVRLSSLLSSGIETPFFIYSTAQLVSDWQAYAQAVRGLDAMVGYAVKANSNPAILRLLASYGAGAIAVSDHEIRLALDSGFAPSRMLLHGNGKRPRDIDAALRTATAIGDDTLQRQATGRVVPDSFTHGSAAQRRQWFMTGYQQGTVAACNTFGNGAL